MIYTNMNLQSHIIRTIPIFKLTTSMEEIVRFFKDTTYSHVAVTENGKFLGVICENDLEEFDVATTLKDFRYSLEAVFVHTETSWLDVLEAFSRNEANLLPVLNEDAVVQGYYELNTIVSVFIDTPFFSEPGGILVVAKGVKDYSFSEIAQIVETNNTKIIGAFITDNKNDLIQVTLKIGAENLNDVIQTFRRYNYSILFGNNDDQFLEDLKERSDYLDKYLNV